MYNNVASLLGDGCVSGGMVKGLSDIKACWSLFLTDLNQSIAECEFFQMLTLVASVTAFLLSRSFLLIIPISDLVVLISLHVGLF